MPSTTTRPLPLADWPAAARVAVVGMLTDIDDTLTEGGTIVPAALAALGRLQAAGLPVVAVTGRPMGWSELFALQWPVRAIVAENGAVALIRDGGGLRTEFLQDAGTRAHNARRLAAALDDIERRIPGARRATDSAGRVTDIAIDHSEHYRLDEAAIAQVVALMQGHGMCATISSIHVNGWFGDHDKWQGARWIVQRLFGRELADEAGRWAYVGDSTNDQVMFRNLPQSVGVANLTRFAGRLEQWPAYLAHGERGDGFAEVADALLAARSG